ncbi:coat protein [Subterranean clover mottle virus]|uniref:Capsid protein n=1 Tax=Subterranean clover mottle virus TaxID=12472 RepID=Q8BEQ0_9VIRU|nr:capsid protein [Subterranean clover mottle virus]AAN51928.1 coat protein [Subterranean clover mottle virus]AAR32105.1 coat protein [Subterranean clover mottle virus]AAR32109.1 coat protein [Subterranean clover mottle virus]AAR32113.1 coat protein [Subterranean clover mottle virus]AAR32117.1 coat protein [Subterranean clover mottle virus]
MTGRRVRRSKKKSGQETTTQQNRQRSGGKQSQNQMIQVKRERTPMASTVVIGRSFPAIHSEGTRTRVCHTELIRAVDINTIFTLNFTWCIPSAFPWLSGVAVNWSKWRWVSLRFTYMPAAATTTQGTVALGYLYDALDAVPAALQQMSSLAGFSTGAVWSGSEGSVLLRAANKNGNVPGAVSSQLNIADPSKYYRYENLTNFAAIAEGTKNLYAPARLAVAAANGAADVGGVGTVYATYVVELIDPISSALNS